MSSVGEGLLPHRVEIEPAGALRLGRGRVECEHLQLEHGSKPLQEIVRLQGRTRAPGLRDDAKCLLDVFDADGQQRRCNIQMVHPSFEHCVKPGSGAGTES